MPKKVATNDSGIQAKGIATKSTETSGKVADLENRIDLVAQKRSACETNPAL